MGLPLSPIQMPVRDLRVSWQEAKSASVKSARSTWPGVFEWSKTSRLSVVAMTYEKACSSALR